MLLGIMSDSHDNLPKIDAAVTKLNSLGVEHVLHAGDFCAPFAALPYQRLEAKMLGVFGNNDAERGLLAQKFQSVGHQVEGRFASPKIDGVKIALMHGDETRLFQSLSTTQAYDLIIFGHTHQLSQSQEGRTALLNPGGVCGYLSGRATIATFDTRNRRVEILDI